jgi:hypothetical protein
MNSPWKNPYPQPQTEDWGAPTFDMDVESARDQFMGRNGISARELFDRNVVAATESIEHLPPIPFRYYLAELGGYVLDISGNQDNSADAGGNFIASVLFNIENNSPRIIGMFPGILDVVDAVASRQAALDAPVEIYGDFEELARRIRNIYELHHP